MIEVVNKIKQVEQEADNVRRIAASEARDIEAAAHTAGKELLVRSRREAAAAAEVLLADAEKRAEKLSADERQRYTSQGEALAKKAEGRLDEAAALIAERIVKAV